MDRNRVAVAGVLVVALLLVLVWYPGTFVGPGHDRAYYEHHVDSASTAAYEQRLDTIARERESVSSYEEGEVVEEVIGQVRYEELSPAAQTMFDRTLDAPTDASGSHVYDPVVCREGNYVCTGLPQDDLPDEFTYGQTDPAEAAVIVLRDGDRYLFSTGSVTYTPMDGQGLGLVVILFVMKGLVLVPFSAFLLAFSTGLATESRRWTAGGLGGALALVVIAYGASTDLLGSLFLSVGLLLMIVAATPPTEDVRLRAIAVALGAIVAAFSVVPAHLHPIVPGQSIRLYGIFLTAAAAIGSLLALSAAALRVSDDPQAGLSRK